MRVKLLSNLLFAAIAQSTLRLIEAASAMGIDEQSILRAVQSGSGASAAAELMQLPGGAAGFVERVTPFMTKDVDVASRMASAMDVDVDALLAAVSAEPINFAARNDR